MGPIPGVDVRRFPSHSKIEKSENFLFFVYQLTYLNFSCKNFHISSLLFLSAAHLSKKVLSGLFQHWLSSFLLKLRYYNNIDLTGR